MIDTDRGEGAIVTVTAGKSMPVVVQSDAPSGDRGFGDTIARVTHATGLDRLAHLYTRVTGKDCGCKRRQQKLNDLIPYRRV